MAPATAVPVGSRVSPGCTSAIAVVVAETTMADHTVTKTIVIGNDRPRVSQGSVIDAIAHTGAPTRAPEVIIGLTTSTIV
jgi:hypothetical protein